MVPKIAFTGRRADALNRPPSLSSSRATVARKWCREGLPSGFDRREEHGHNGEAGVADVEEPNAGEKQSRRVDLPTPKRVRSLKNEEYECSVSGTTRRERGVSSAQGAGRPLSAEASLTVSEAQPVALIPIVKQFCAAQFRPTFRTTDGIIVWLQRIQANRTDVTAQRSSTAQHQASTPDARRPKHKIHPNDEHGQSEGPDGLWRAPTIHLRGDDPANARGQKNEP